MKTLVVADIFGYSEALQQLATQLATQLAGEDFLIIDPYAGQLMAFANEQQAYTYFSENIGVAGYAQLLQEKLNTIKAPFNLIAFSVGGAAVWLNLESLTTTKVNQVVCFYPSQIRYYLQQQSALPLTIVLPKSEPLFDVTQLKKRLLVKKNVVVEQCEYLHGFMNQLSTNFSPTAYQDYLQRLANSKTSW